MAVGLAVVAGEFMHAGVAHAGGDFRHVEVRMLHEAAGEAEADLLQALHGWHADGGAARAGEGVGTAAEPGAEVAQRPGAVDVLPGPGLDLPPKLAHGGGGGMAGGMRADACDQGQQMGLAEAVAFPRRG
jgi:hypothetical protein